MNRAEIAALKAEGQIGAESPIGAVARPWRNFLRLVAHVERLEAAATALVEAIDTGDRLARNPEFYTDELRDLRAALAATKEPDRG